MDPKYQLELLVDVDLEGCMLPLGRSRRLVGCVEGLFVVVVDCRNGDLFLGLFVDHLVNLFVDLVGLFWDPLSALF